MLYIIIYRAEFFSAFLPWVLDDTCKNRLTGTVRFSSLSHSSLLPHLVWTCPKIRTFTETLYTCENGRASVVFLTILQHLNWTTTSKIRHHSHSGHEIPAHYQCCIKRPLHASLKQKETY